jgi:hypothetical protein
VWAFQKPAPYHWKKHLKYWDIGFAGDIGNIFMRFIYTLFGSTKITMNIPSSELLGCLCGCPLGRH